MRESIRALIAEVMGANEADLPPTLTPQTVQGWDSLRHLELMLALELEFQVTIPGEHMPNLLSDEAIAEFVGAAAPNRA